MGEARLVAPPVLSVQDFDRLNKEREKQLRLSPHNLAMRRLNIKTSKFALKSLRVAVPLSLIAVDHGTCCKRTR